jgi:hypothetical protein
LATVPAAEAATAAYVVAPLPYLALVLAGAEAEARALVAETAGGIADLDRARLALDRAQGYTGAQPAESAQVAARWADVAKQGNARRPAIERHRRATEPAAMVRWLVASAYGDSMRGFASEQHGATRPWADVAAFGRA